jgi:cytochrome subunit of sulfide dehydrogenase
MQRLSATLLWFFFTSITSLAQAENPPNVAIRTLAASCAACHGPDGNSLGGTPTLAALNQQYFVQRMQGFKDGSVSSTVMHHHAKGLTTEEITALAAYFAQQARKTPQPLPHQSFLGAQ